MPSDHLRNLIGFIEASPTSYHAAAAMATTLTAAGFTEVNEQSPWSQVPQTGFTRRDGALLAWRQPAVWNSATGLKIVAAHTDSPALKVKPGSEYSRAGARMLETEVYGGPILHTWFDRDLAVAGRLVNTAGQVQLVRTPGRLRVPTLAVHLDRSVNTELAIDAQRDLNALTGLVHPDVDYDELLSGLAEQCGWQAADVAGYDLFCVPAEPPALLGLRNELLASYRLDNLASTHSCLAGLLAATATDQVQIFVAFDHEEIGSITPSGASGSLLADVLRRLSAAHGLSSDQHLAWLARAIALSADVTHGLHPARTDRYDPIVWPVLNGGPVLKWSAPMRYTTDATTMAAWQRACTNAGVEHQVFVNNNNVRGGSTIGPLMASRLGVRTVDAGIAVLSMHSARELCGADDPQRFTKVVTEFLLLD